MQDKYYLTASSVNSPQQIDNTESLIVSTEDQYYSLTLALVMKVCCVAALFSALPFQAARAEA